MKFLKNALSLLVFSCFIIGTVFSQRIDSSIVKTNKDNIRFPNIVKLNSLALAFNNVSLIYERGIIPRVSAGIGIGYKYKGIGSSLLNVNNSVISVNFDDIKGFSVTPEARYYLRSCDPGKLEGFYTGLYFRYTG